MASVKRVLVLGSIVAAVPLGCGGDDAGGATGGGATSGNAGTSAGAAGASGSAAAGGTQAGAAGTAGSSAGAAGSAAGGSAQAGAAGTAGGGGASGGTTKPCDPVLQTCPPGAASKCTLLTDGQNNTVGCVPQTGAVGEGAPCKREADGPAGFGHDDCAAGLFCTFIGALPPSAGGTRLCRTLCHVDATCPKGQRCAALDEATPKDGFCGPTCDAFSTTCAAGLECSRLWPAADPAAPPAFLTCRLPGQKASGAACDPVAEDCVAGHVCVDPLLGLQPTCTPLCDDAHPCKAGSCVTAGGSVGVCFG